MENIYTTILFISLLAPLASFVATSASGNGNPKIRMWISVSLLLLSFCCAVYLLATLWNEPPLLIQLDWFNVGSHSFSADLALSNRSIVMLTVVSLISLLVHVYSTAYMEEDEHLKRYFAMLGFFTFAMQGIVLSDNLLFLFIFWELVGFSSYMLIGHWTKKPAAGRAATKAFVMNRIGDAGFLVGLMIIWAAYDTFSLTTILASPPPSFGLQTAASLCIFCGVIGKSAQFPLFTWLPDAMEGPTPVSALIHAATMVAAGVYMLVRVFDLFTESALLVVAITGMITTLIGALAALSQYDIKKILAYSTMSQLGLMILTIGMGVVDAAFLHLLTHAFFKACLFLSAGMVTHALHKAQPAHLHTDLQDIRNLGGLQKKMPVTFAIFLTGAASLAGVPFFSGFLSKEAILITLFTHGGILSWFMLVVILSVSFLTVMYIFRLAWFVFMAEAGPLRTADVAEPGWMMRAPTAMLAVCSLWFLVSWNPFDFKGWMFNPLETTAYALWITAFSILWVILALLLSWSVFKGGKSKSNKLFHNAFYINHAYDTLLGKTVRSTNQWVTWFERKVIDRSIHATVYIQVIFAHLVAWFDRAFIDGAANSTARLTGLGGKITRSFQGGNIQVYIFWAAFGVIIFIIWTLK